MGTPYMAGVLQPDGKIRAIYGNWDGHISGHGITLLKNWSDREKLAELLKQGDVSSLGTCIGEKHVFDDRSKEGTEAYIGTHEKGWTTFYKRDRGETGVNAKTYRNLPTLIARAEEDYGADYVYVYDLEGKWRAYCKRLHPTIPRSVEEMPVITLELVLAEVKVVYTAEAQPSYVEEVTQQFAEMAAA